MGAALAKKNCPRCGRSFDPDAVFCPHDGAALEPETDGGPESDPYIGMVLPGDIEIRSVAGVGAMGRVYRAHQRGIDRDVAVKILHRELSGNRPLVQRFHREAKIASKLQHPHVVEVYLAGQLPDGALYIAMEFLDGLSLATALAEAGGSFPLERTLPIALQICDAVGEGHARGIVHRDLKPENAMLVHRADTRDWVKVLDFGIAKVSLGEQSMETAAGLIFGTARYISPEGAQGATVGPPGDVYAIATMLYQMLAGRTPFDAEQPVGLLVKHLHEEPPPLRSWPAAANVPEPIVRVVMENLAKEAARRLPNGRALGNALAAAAREAHVSFADVGVVARMSVPEVAAARATTSVDRTLDDSVPPVRIVTGHTPVSDRDAAFDATSAATPTPKEISEHPSGAKAGPSGTLALAPPARIEAPTAKDSRPPPSRPSRREKRTGLLVVLLAFLLGVAVAVLVTQEISKRRVAEYDDCVARARRALADERFIAPPGDNVRDIVSTGLQRWPDDAKLEQVKSDASHALVTRAMAARSAGDVRQARTLVKTALDFDPSDHAAAILLDEYDGELGLTLDGGGANAPSVLMDLPDEAVHKGSHIELVARLSINGGPPKTGVHNARFHVTGPGIAASGATIAAGQSGKGIFAATLTPDRAGSYVVVFEANADGIPFRAEDRLTIKD